MSPSLESPRLKLGRADEHLDVLDEELGVLFKSYAYRKLLEHALDGPWHVVRVNPPAKPLPPPPRLSLICGDAVQNIRAALDHLVWQLVLLEGNEPDKSNSFPAYMKKGQFDANVRHPKNPERRPSPLHGIDPNGAERKFGLALADLLQRFGLPDAAVVDEYLKSNPRPDGRKHWVDIVSHYRTDVIHYGHLHLGPEGQGWRDVWTVINHLHDVMARTLLQTLGYDGGYQPAVVTGPSVPYEVDWVKPDTSARALGYGASAV